MKRRELRKAAAAKIAQGYTRQHAYDALRIEEPTADNEDLADAVRYTPSLRAREHFKTERNLLSVLVVALGVFYFWQVAVQIHDHGYSRRLFFLAFPIVLLFLGLSSTRNRGRPYSRIAFFALISANYWLPWSDVDLTDTRTIIGLVLTLAVIALAVYLHRKLTSDYTLLRDPNEGMQKRAVFPPEPGALA